MYIYAIPLILQYWSATKNLTIRYGLGVSRDILQRRLCSLEQCSRYIDQKAEALLFKLRELRKTLHVPINLRTVHSLRHGNIHKGGLWAGSKWCAFQKLGFFWCRTNVYISKPINLVEMPEFTISELKLPICIWAIWQYHATASVSWNCNQVFAPQFEARRGWHHAWFARASWALRQTWAEIIKKALNIYSYKSVQYKLSGSTTGPQTHMIRALQKPGTYMYLAVWVQPWHNRQIIEKLNICSSLQVIDPKKRTCQSSWLHVGKKNKSQICDTSISGLHNLWSWALSGIQAMKTPPQMAAYQARHMGELAAICVLPDQVDWLTRPFFIQGLRTLLCGQNSLEMSTTIRLCTYPVPPFSFQKVLASGCLSEFPAGITTSFFCFLQGLGLWQSFSYLILFSNLRKFFIRVSSFWGRGCRCCSCRVASGP